MSNSTRAERQPAVRPLRLRDWFADQLGVSTQRKGDIYLDISRSASLNDVSYWLQILFASGIATLGLALNSPAVIIGAMLISPLMGPILAAGLALASGDMILGLRSLTNLALSCLLAILFAVILVALLPFKEMTGEIAARTQPNTLDLAVALFSGAIGSIAICKEVRGVVTSIPGVAIAVALMPPLCVVGYGIGISFSLGASQGLQVARGGGLLFLTNLVAITFTAMIVFLALHIDSGPVRERVRQWREENSESLLLQNFLNRIHISENVRMIGSLPGRIMIIGVPILLILIPLSQSLAQLQQEIAVQQSENRIRRDVTELWQNYFGQKPNGEPRSYLDQLFISEQAGSLALALTVITSDPYSPDERSDCAKLIAERLERPLDSLSLQIIEIPTTAQLALRAREEKVEPIPTVAQLQSNFLSGVDRALSGLVLPPPAKLLSYSVTTSKNEPLQVHVSYLSDRDIEKDAIVLIEEYVRSRMGFSGTKLSLERVAGTIGTMKYNRNQAAFPAESLSLLDIAGSLLYRHANLLIEVALDADESEQPDLSEERVKLLTEHLKSRWQVDEARIQIKRVEGKERTATIRLRLSQI
ncbi:MAG TPA: DUF389 domain-containing protein [Blastocatellia bacterium]|nr:DUF389 domain-containing protein [Blastocatellia bacterium]